MEALQRFAGRRWLAQACVLGVWRRRWVVERPVLPAGRPRVYQTTQDAVAAARIKNRARRAAAASCGKCATCKCRLADPGLKYCGSCREDNRIAKGNRAVRDRRDAADVADTTTTSGLPLASRRIAA